MPPSAPPGHVFQGKPYLEKTHAPCPRRHHSQWPRHGRSLGVRRQTAADRRGAHTQRTITQPQTRMKQRTINCSGWGGYIQTSVSVTLNNRDNCLENIRGKCAKGKTCHDIFGNKSNNKCTLSTEEKISTGLKIQKEIQ